MNYEKKYKILIVSFLIFTIFSCVHKQALWRDRDENIIGSEIPKDIFKVGEYLVVAYEGIDVRKNNGILHKFIVTKSSEQCLLTYVQKIFGYGYLLCDEFFIDTKYFIKRSKEGTFKTPYDSYAFLSMSDDEFTYVETKYHVISRIINKAPIIYDHIVS